MQAVIKYLGLSDYEACLTDMQAFVQSANETTAPEIWLVEHPPVYTQGTACTLSALAETDIPIVKTDRGGQITYHGPGQLVVYPLLKLKDFGLGVKAMVAVLEQTAIDVLANYQIIGQRLEGAPGVYVDTRKIAALGLRVKRGWSYHGLSLNVDMDLSPFLNIDPCGYKGLEVSQLKDFVADISMERVRECLLEKLSDNILKHGVVE